RQVRAHVDVEHQPERDAERKADEGKPHSGTYRSEDDLDGLGAASAAQPLARKYTFPGLRTSTQRMPSSGWLANSVRTAVTCRSRRAAASARVSFGSRP